MKRYEEDRDHFSLLKSLDVFARNRGLSILEPTTREQLLTVLNASLEGNIDHAARLHGLRAQSMFAYTIAAMGACQAISEEDAGTLFDLNGDLQRPDFRIVTRDGQQMLVEVKNFHPKNPVGKLRIEGAYLRSLKRYAALNNLPLRIAIYWSRWNTWTLLDAERLDSDQDRLFINMPEAFAHNEMHLLGDSMIGTEPPLAFRLYADKDKPRSIDADGKAGFTVARATLSAAGTEVTDPLEKRIGWFLLLNGDWGQSEEHAEVNNELVDFFEVQFFPSPPPDDEPDPQRFRSIGFLSQLITAQYRQSTSRDGKITTLSPKNGPDRFGIAIPNDYKGKVLKLWRFTILPQHLHDSLP